LEESAGITRRLDTIYYSILGNEKKFSDLWNVVKMCLIFSHGNASVESGFSINKALLIENLHEDTIVNQRIVYDVVQHAGEVESILIDGNLLQFARHARANYKRSLEENRCRVNAEQKVKEESNALRREVMKLEEKQMRIQKNAQLEAAAIDLEVKNPNKKRKTV
jgi:hypothetical protein